MLLLDPGHEDLFDYLPAEAAALNEQMKPDPAKLPELSDEQREAALTAWRKVLAGWPDDLRDELAAHHVERWRTGLAESADLESEVYPELRRGGPTPDVPTIVLSAGAGNPAWAAYGSPELVQRALDGIRTLHAGLAKSVTRGEHRVLAGATHQFLHVERPDEVRGALRDLLAALQ